VKGRTVVATGATSGVGEAAVLVLSSMGDRVVLVVRNEQRAEATLNALEARALRRSQRVAGGRERDGTVFHQARTGRPSPAARDDARAKTLREASEALADAWD
jgi:NAD(P)-dependent dehydrogenase (short-subunit alcohol dehydrogenase family)